MFNDWDFDLLFTLAGPGKPGLSEAELCALEPLPDEYFGKDGQQPVSIADALLHFRKDLSGLLKDGERLSRFSAEYIHTSRLIRRGITILGQGLMTLHREGFDLSTYPLNLYELRCLASFHFKKIMNGARVALQSNPKVYYRCMGEYPEWVKLLCRLEVSERKLAKPVKALSASSPVVDAEVSAAGALAEEKPIAQAAALPSMPALPQLPDSRRKELLSSPEKPEEGKVEPQKAGTSKPVKVSSPGKPFTFAPYASKVCASWKKDKSGQPPRIRPHPPRDA